MHRRLIVAAGVVGVALATAGAALATNAAFETPADSPPASAIAGLSTVAEVEPSATDVEPSGRPQRERARTYSVTVGDEVAATVTIRIAGRDLELVDVEPRAGWTSGSVERGRANGVAHLEIELRDATRSIEFVALLVDDEIVTRIHVDDEGEEGERDEEPDGDEGSGAGSVPATHDSDDDGDDDHAEHEVDEDGPEVDEDGPEPTEAPEVDEDGPEVDEDGPEPTEPPEIER